MAFEAVNGEKQGEGQRQERQGQAMSLSVIQGFHVIVDGDLHHLGLPGYVAAYHEHHAELAQGVREAEHTGRQKARLHTG